MTLGRRLRGPRIRLGLVGLLILGSVAALLYVTATPASALSYDYTNPSNGCSASAQPNPVVSGNIINPETGGVLGTVQLRYSTGCRTNWSRVVSNQGAVNILVWADRRYYDGADTRGHDGDPGPWYGSSAYSDQLYGYNITVCANGQIAYYSINGPLTWSSVVTVCA